MPNFTSPRSFAAVVAALMMLGAPHEASAASGSLSVCADLNASAGDVALHCRRALQSGGLSDAQTFGANINLGEALISLGQPSLAVDAFNAAAAIDARRAEPIVGRASALEDLERFEQAAKDWFTAVRLAPRSLDARLGKGAFHLRRGAAAAALKEFDAAFRIDPDEIDALYNRGLANLALSRFDEAERDFSRVLREYPSDAGAHFQRARSRAARDPSAALSDFARTMELAPEWPDPWFLSGRLLDSLGRTEEANRHLRRAFELGHKDPWLLERITVLGG